LLVGGFEAERERTRDERRQFMNRFFTLILLVLALLGLCKAGPVMAQEKPDLEGWGKDSEYNRYYQTSEHDEFKGTVDEILEIKPLPGMAPGVGLKIKDQDGDMVAVQLGPKSFVNVDSIGLKKGDRVKVKGSWAQIAGKDVFLASKVKKGENVELKVRRTKDGMPYWTMTPEELAKEKQQ
jgi:hypothetical protein